MKQAAFLRCVIRAGILALFAIFVVKSHGGSLLYFVNTTSDTVVIGACENGNPGCSLRGAIQAANANPGSDGIQINLPNGSIINLIAALPNITDSVSITGAGASALTVRRDTGGSYRIFNITAGPVIISGMTISNGSVPSNAGGGGVLNSSNSGAVTITNCVLTGNSAGGGGAVSNSFGTLNITSCTLSGNSAEVGGGILTNGGILNVSNSTITGNSAQARTGFTGHGGGISNVDGGSGQSAVTVTHSTIANNFAIGGPGTGGPNPGGTGERGLGGGISSDGGAVKVINSTVAGNLATGGNGGFGTTVGRGGNGSGGGIFCDGGTLGVTNSTVSGNSVNGGLGSPFGDGIGGGWAEENGAQPSAKNTIIGNNVAATFHPDVSGSFLSQGFNLIGKVDGGSGFTQSTDLMGTVASPLDPKLDPAVLQNHGGPTQTIALLPDSPAIDKGSSNGLFGNLTTDQRGSGFPRKTDYPIVGNASGGDGTDIGAVEFGGPLIPISVSRKTHGATNFDIYLSQTGNAGVECRTGGPSGNHQMIMNFPAPVSLTSASVTTGTGSVSSHSVNGSNVTVNLTGIANAQKIITTLFGVSDGSNTGDVTIPMSVLLGDATGNGSVNASDVSLTKSKSGQPVDASNFREDVTVSNSINSSDVSLVKSKSGTALP